MMNCSHNFNQWVEILMPAPGGPPVSPVLSGMLTAPSACGVAGSAHNECPRIEEPHLYLVPYDFSLHLNSPTLPTIHYKHCLEMFSTLIHVIS